MMIVVCVCVCDEPDGYNTRQKLYHLERMRSGSVKEIEAIPNFLYRNRILLSVVFEDELFEV